MTRADWTDQQNDAIVADYFAMLLDDIADQSYSKAEHNRRLQAFIQRPRGSIEYKHQNISAVLMGLGEPLDSGYKPAFNFQASLVDAVVRHLNNHEGWCGVHSPASNICMRDGPLEIAPSPNLRNEVPSPDLAQVNAIAAKFDVAGRDDRNRILGRAGEELAFARERAMLKEAGREDLARRVRWVSQEDGDGAGFDIASFDLNGRERLLEVKTTNGWERTPFYISRNELEVANARSTDWHLLRIWDFARKPSGFELRPPLEHHVSLSPTVFRANFNA